LGASSRVAHVWMGDSNYLDQYFFVAAGWSAYIVWQAEPGSSRSIFLMTLYALLEVVTLSCL
jgi:hypothetical protein